MIITAVRGLQVIDSRGSPTVKAYITLNDGSVHSSSVPSGASVGSHEAKELRDTNSPSYFGLGVTKAINNIENHIAKALKGRSIESPKLIDEILLSIDHTDNKSILGSNATLAVSQATVRAASYSLNVPLWKFINSYYFSGNKPDFPKLFVNVINGGRHANWSYDIQEFIIIPKKTRPADSIKIAVEIFLSIKKELTKRNLSTLVGDEGGESPQLDSNEQVFDLIRKSALSRNLSLGVDYDLGIDLAASQWFKDNRYYLKKEELSMSSEALEDRYRRYISQFNVRYFEDPFWEDDWNAFVNFNRHSGQNCTIIGDDLFATNIKRIEKGIEKKAASGVVIKPNQIGTILETTEAIKLSKKAKWRTIISHRSGDTEDTFIADLAYGCGADFIKTGSMSRSERLAKYNRLLEIEAFEKEIS